MTAQAIEERSAYRALYDTIHGDPNSVPAWVKDLRAVAMERFDEAGFPTTDEEDWKYTNVAPIAKDTFTFATKRHGVTAEQLASFV